MTKEEMQRELKELRTKIKKFELLFGVSGGEVNPEYRQLVVHDEPGHTWRRHYNPEGWIEDTFEDAVCYPALVTYIWPQMEAPGQLANLAVFDYLGRYKNVIKAERDYAPAIKRDIEEGGTAEETPVDPHATAMSRVMVGDIVAYDPALDVWYHPREEAFE